MFIFRRCKSSAINVTKGNHESKILLDKLDSFLNDLNPCFVRILLGFWGDQQQAVTYKELSEAIENGFEAELLQWQEDYANLLSSKIRPLYKAAMRSAARNFRDKKNLLMFDSDAEEISHWIYKHGARFISNVSQEQRSAIRAILLNSYSESWTAEQTAQYIRPLIGLTKPQAAANINYRQHVRDTLLSENPEMKVEVAEKHAHEAAVRYAQKQQMYRATNIANTEMAMAYNQGYHESVRQAIRQGIMGPVVKVWSTAKDDRTCPICSVLDGKKIGFEDSFDFGTTPLFPGASLTAPAHPGCRCGVMYEEISEPALTPARYSAMMEVRQPIESDKVVTTHESNHLHGDANSVVDIIKPGASYVSSRLFYDSNGYLETQIDTTGHNSVKDHPYGNNGEHAQDYVYDDDGNLIDRFTRDLSDLERSQNAPILKGDVEDGD